MKLLYLELENFVMKGWDGMLAFKPLLEDEPGYYKQEIAGIPFICKSASWLSSQIAILRRGTFICCWQDRWQYEAMFYYFKAQRGNNTVVDSLLSLISVLIWYFITSHLRITVCLDSVMVAHKTLVRNSWPLFNPNHV